MRRYVMLIILVVLSASVFGQQKDGNAPDYAAIEKMARDANSIFYYPPLFIRYTNNDTALTMREYRMLYYGSFYRDGYTVMEDTSVDERLNSILGSDNIKINDWVEVIRLCKLYLEKRPFELKKLNLIYFALKNLGDTAQERVYADKIKKIAYAILSSGDGLSENSGLHVVEISDEYSIINMLGYEYTGQKELRGDRCDYLELSDNAEHLPGMYFDLKQLFIAYQKVLDGAQAGK